MKNGVGGVLMVGAYMLMLSGCGQTATHVATQGPALEQGKKNRLVIAASDYHTGALSTIDLRSGQITADAVPIFSDSIVRGGGSQGELFVLNRLGADNLQVISEDDKTRLQFSVGRGSNPQDVAVIDDHTTYISRYASPRLLKVDPSTGTTLKEIDLEEVEGLDLSAFPDPDGLPEMTYLHRSGGKLFVSLERLNERAGFVPTGLSLLAVIDLSNDSVQWRKLALTNPITDFKTGYDGALYLGEAGNLSDRRHLTGGIERVDPATGTGLGTVITEAALGGFIVDFEITGPHSGLAIVSTPDTELISFDPTTGKAGKVLRAPKGYTLRQLVWDSERGLVYLADRDLKQPCIRSYDANSLSEVARLVWPLDLPPYQMALVN